VNRRGPHLCGNVEITHSSKHQILLLRAVTCIEIAPGGEADPFHRGIAEIRPSFARIIPGFKDAQTSIKGSRGGPYWLNGEKMLLVLAHCEGGFTGGSTRPSARLYQLCQ